MSFNNNFKTKFNKQNQYRQRLQSFTTGEFEKKNNKNGGLDSKSNKAGQTSNKSRFTAEHLELLNKSLSSNC